MLVLLEHIGKAMELSGYFNKNVRDKLLSGIIKALFYI